MLNPITELGGTQFLVFYGALIAATAALCWWWIRLNDPTASMPTPAIPSELDPCEIAYLRGEEAELTKAVIVGLYYRGYLLLDWDTERSFRQAPNHPGVDKLSALERSAFEWFAESHSPSEIESELRGNVGSYCVSYEEKFRQEQLLSSQEAGNADWSRLIGIAVIAVAGVARAYVGHTREQPIGFLVIMCICGCLAIWCCGRSRLSSRGQRYLEQFQHSSAHLKNRPADGMATSDFLLLMGAFGLTALAGTGFQDLENVFKRIGTNNSSGNAGGCGDGGGCGGCGGCG